MDVLDGFGGLAQGMLEHLRDEHPKLPMLIYAMEGHSFRGSGVSTEVIFNNLIF